MTAELSVTVEEIPPVVCVETHMVDRSEQHLGSAKVEDFKEVQIHTSKTAETTVDFNTLPQDETTVFTQEKDAPELSVRVYDFEMAKEKTLPRNRNGLKLFPCTSLSKPVAAGILATAFVIITVVILVWQLALH